MPKTTIPITAGTDRHLSHVNWGEFVKLSDEDLCKNTQRGCPASRNLLWHRYTDFIQMIVRKENQRQHLPKHEIADALQELYFAFHTAVQRYDPENYWNGRSASFKTFLKIIVARKFSNYCTLWRIYHRRVTLDFDDDASLSFTVGAMDGNGCSSAECEGILPSELSSDSLTDALCRLKPKERLLLKIWLQCGRDKEVAKALDISPAAAKLRRERLFRRIRQSTVRK